MAATTQPTFRFAPSPNGHLHLGHAYSALTTANLAARLGGRVLLRIEDIDTARTRPEFVAAIFEDLAWIGFEWSGPVWHQSNRSAAHQDALSKLDHLGVLYNCSATRKDITANAVDRPGETTAADAGTDTIARDPDGAPRYTPICRAHLSETQRVAGWSCAKPGPYAKRLDMKRAREHAPGPLAYTVWSGASAFHVTAAEPDRWGDAVIARKDIGTSYHLAVVVDDAAQGVTHVTRGQDLEAATDLHRVLQTLLGLPTPVYHHHRLIAANDDRKLSKGFKDKGLRHLRQEGATPEDIWALIGMRPPGR